jgi:hypothetical protein
MTVSVHSPAATPEGVRDGARPAGLQGGPAGGGSAAWRGRKTRVLVVLLALQLAVIAVLLWSDRGISRADGEPLLTFDPEAVHEIRISTTENDSSVVIERDGAGWRLADGHPADGDRVKQALHRLASLRAGWPVATSAAAGTRFDVAPGQHQRRVVLAADGAAAAELYLGTSPGFQHVHARRAGDDAIYSVPLSNFQLPTSADEWLDKTLLQPRGFLASISREGDWRLAREDDAWVVDGEPADQEAAGRLERRLVELRVTGAAAAPAADAAPLAVFELVDPQGPYRLTLYGAADGNDYRVSSDRRDGFYQLAPYIADQLLLDRAALLPAVDDEP